jgi:hypothetical protein
MVLFEESSTFASSIDVMICNVNQLLRMYLMRGKGVEVLGELAAVQLDTAALGLGKESSFP